MFLYIFFTVCVSHLIAKWKSNVTMTLYHFLNLVTSVLKGFFKLTDVDNLNKLIISFMENEANINSYSAGNCIVN